jgi:hypothetical protein
MTVSILSIQIQLYAIKIKLDTVSCVHYTFTVLFNVNEGYTHLSINKETTLGKNLIAIHLCLKFLISCKESVITNTMDNHIKLDK